MSAEVAEVLARPAVRFVLTRYGIDEGALPPRALFGRVVGAAMPRAYRRRKLAIFLLGVMPAGVGLLFGVAGLHLWAANVGPPLTGIIPFLATMAGFFAGLLFGFVLANRLPMRPAWRDEWNRLAQLFELPLAGQAERRLSRPFMVAALALLLLGISLALVPGVW